MAGAPGQEEPPKLLLFQEALQEANEKGQLPAWEADERGQTQEWFIKQLKENTAAKAEYNRRCKDATPTNSPLKWPNANKRWQAVHNPEVGIVQAKNVYVWALKYFHDNGNMPGKQGTGLAKVTLKVKNDLDPEFQPYQACVSVPPQSSVYTLLLQASANDPNFTFQAEYYGSYSSHLITSINGVAASEEDRTFWRFENKKKVKFDRGVDLIGVSDKDVIIFRFKHYDLPNPDDPPSDCDD